MKIFNTETQCLFNVNAFVNISTEGNTIIGVTETDDFIIYRGTSSVDAYEVLKEISQGLIENKTVLEI